MKRVVLVIMAVLLLAGTCWAQMPVGAPSKATGQEVTITGVLSCTFCNLPAAGKCTKECCQACIKSGDPVLLTDAKATSMSSSPGSMRSP